MTHGWIFVQAERGQSATYLKMVLLESIYKDGDLKNV